MELVDTTTDISRNLDYLDSVRVSNSVADRQRYNDLIGRGTCFLAYQAEDGIAFAPSRFIGYKNNTFALHEQNNARDGRDTNPRISVILGTDPHIDPGLEQAYREFCASLGFTARERGTAGAPHRYWAALGIRQPSSSVASIMNDTPLPISSETSGGTMSRFEIGRRYTREDTANILGLSERERRGNWLTGYSRQRGEFFIFANIGAAGRTGHNYANRWEGKRLVWFARGNAKLGQSELSDLLSGEFAVHVFWRCSDRGEFTYAGRVYASEVLDASPVQVTWGFSSPQGLETKSPQRQPNWRRGPPPRAGSRLTTRTDGPTSVYLMTLEGPVQSAFPNLQPDQRIIKVGISNDVDRRLEELSWGFPPGCALNWAVVSERILPDADAAFAIEGELLERLRLNGRWIGGEFAVVNGDEIPSLADLC